MKNRKALILLFSVLFLSLLLVGCLPSGTTPTPEPENELPIITSTPITTAIVGFVYVYDVNATDPDGDALTYTLSVAPIGMNIDYSTGIISWSPSSFQLGDNEVVVRVSDGTSSVTQSFVITVSLIGRILESIEVLPETMELSVAQSLSITSVIATYDNEDEIDIALADCTYASDPTGIVSIVDGVITGVAVGTATITISYTEGAVTVTDTVVVTVIPRVLQSITVLPATMIVALTNCTYASDAPGIASVAANGVITGESVGGPVTITVSYTEGAVTTTDTVEVTVVVANIFINPPTVVASVGNQFTIDIVVEGVIELQGVTVVLGFDDSVISFNSAIVGDFLPAPLLMPPAESTNSVALTIAGTGIPNYSSGAGTVITVTFDAVAAGNADISFSSTELRHDVATLIPHNVKNECTVTIN